MKLLQYCNNSIAFYILWCYNAQGFDLEKDFERSAQRVLKRLQTILIALAVLLSMLPLAVYAATDTEEQRVRKQIESVYWKTLASSGRESLHGYCGVMAGWELYHLGVTKTAVTHNGNDMYDMLRISDQICDGYSAECYSASSYTIEEALNTITAFGTRDAYNIMVGFQWTRTAAGSLYGHVTVIHAVLNGKVYFTEGFMTPFNPDPSKAMVCTISEFDDYYNSWASFEGMIHFGNGGRIAGCETYSCDLFVAAVSPAELLPAPMQADAVRTVAAGERLYATALCQNSDGELFYCVEENGQNWFVAAKLMKPVWFNYDDLTVTDLKLPQHLAQGENFKLSGVIRSRNRIYNAVAVVTDEKGSVVMSVEMLKQSNMVDLSSRSVSTRTDISNLPAGRYTYAIYCDITNHYAADAAVAENMKRILIGSSDFTVGDIVPADKSKTAMVPTVERKAAHNGWQYEDGQWRYYDNGNYRTGWFSYEGINYYFLEDGAAATGWHNLNGRFRYFTETGAMRTGWLKTAEGDYYLLSNGIPATGVTPVGEALYAFGQDGKLQTDTVVEYNGAACAVTADGIVTE